MGDHRLRVRNYALLLLYTTEDMPGAGTVESKTPPALVLTTLGEPVAEFLTVVVTGIDGQHTGADLPHNVSCLFGPVFAKASCFCIPNQEDSHCDHQLLDRTAESLQC